MSDHAFILYCKAIGLLSQIVTSTPPPKFTGAMPVFCPLVALTFPSFGPHLPGECYVNLKLLQLTSWFDFPTVDSELSCWCTFASACATPTTQILTSFLPLSTLSLLPKSLWIPKICYSPCYNNKPQGPSLLLPMIAPTCKQRVWNK